MAVSPRWNFFCKDSAQFLGPHIVFQGLPGGGGGGGGEGGGGGAEDTAHNHVWRLNGVDGYLVRHFIREAARILGHNLSILSSYRINILL